MKKTLNNNLVSSSDLIWLVNCILKYWYLYIIIIPIFSIIGILYNHKQVRQYQTKIEILLKTNEIYNYQDNLNSNLGFYNYYGDISNQKRIIGSYDIIKKVTDKLDLSCSYYIVGRLKTTTANDKLLRLLKSKQNF
jgi:capsular polysaccharide biosynthesis protein